MGRLNEEQNTPMIKMFNSPMFGEIRTIITNEKTNEIWFVLKEISDILGYSNNGHSKEKLRKKDYKVLSFKDSPELVENLSTIL